jgi:hypothetical protein
MRGWERNALAGAAAGLAGTVAMTALMKPGLAGRLPDEWRPSEWVPRQIVRWMEARARRRGALDREAETGAAAAAHLAYGAAMGALYGLARGRWEAPPPALAGAAWGVLVWAAGYQGWLPALGVRPATTEHPPTQWPVPIGNHLLYGIATAAAFQRLRV